MIKWNKGLTHGGRRDGGINGGSFPALHLLLLLLGGEALGLALHIALVALQFIVGDLVEGVRREHRLEETDVVPLVAVYNACGGKCTKAQINGHLLAIPFVISGTTKGGSLIALDGGRGFQSSNKHIARCRYSNRARNITFANGTDDDHVARLESRRVGRVQTQQGAPRTDNLGG